MRMKSLLFKPPLFYVFLIFLCAISLIVLLYCFIFTPKKANAQPYPIQGFDVSHHQGEIKWRKISPKNYQFVYLKATEGGDFKDRLFQNNWLAAREQGLHVGAYHFYRLCRKGRIQAENFIATVPKKTDALPPVIDLEYDNACIHQFTQEQLLAEIKIMHDQLQQHYGKQPIFYTSKNFYNIVLIDTFKNTPIWIREYQDQPRLKDQRAWTFWQYTAKGKIQGIDKAVDLNVFAGSEQDWADFLHNNQVK